MAIRKLWLSLPGAKKLEDSERGSKESHSESDRIMSMIKISNRIMLMEKKPVNWVRSFFSVKLPD